MEEVKIESDFIKLDQFLKWCGECSSGAEAKELIANGKVIVNENIEKQRGKKLRHNDLLQIGNNSYKIVGK
jgi:ribosome-associated protein